MRFTGAGIILVAVIAMVAARWLQPLLFRQSATDPWVFGSVGAIMFTVALIATSAPATSAARSDPNHALRAE